MNMTLDQKLTIQVALAVYAEHCKEAMRLFKGEEMKAYYQKELGRVQEAKTAVEAMEAERFDTRLLEGGTELGPPESGARR